MNFKKRLIVFILCAVLLSGCSALRRISRIIPKPSVANVIVTGMFAVTITRDNGEVFENHADDTAQQSYDESQKKNLRKLPSRRKRKNRRFKPRKKRSGDHEKIQGAAL